MESSRLDPKPALERGTRPLIEFESDGGPRQNRGRSAPRTSADIKEPISASLQRPPPRGAKGRRKKTRKRGNFRGNKATILFRLSNLIQKQPKNKANPLLALPGRASRTRAARR